jgi:hypothetical protein
MADYQSRAEHSYNEPGYSIFSEREEVAKDG